LYLEPHNPFFLVFQFWSLRVVAYPTEIRKGYVLDNCLPLGSESAQQPFDLWNAAAIKTGVKVCEVLSISSPAS
jgi:hypothetical protein